MNMARESCFAYEKKNNGGENCKALNALYCRKNPDCKFYKPRKLKEEDSKKV